jgi:nicotinamide phosphoribosyltransferase
MARDGKLVIRPDSGDPVDIICGLNTKSEEFKENWLNTTFGNKGEYEGVVELLWNIFGGTINEQGYKVLDSHIGAIYGDSITLERQLEIYERLEAKGFASTNIVLGVGSFTYQYNTRDTLGFAAKGAWFEVEENFLATPESVEWGVRTVGYDIYKDPVTDDGTKKSLKGRCAVHIENGEYVVKIQCDEEEEKGGVLQTIYEDGKFYNQTTLTQIRERIDKLVEVE